MHASRRFGLARRCRFAAGLAIILILGGGGSALAQDAQPQLPSSGENKASVTPEAWAWRLQATDILQYSPPFHSRYQGPNSFNPRAITGNTVDATLYGGVRPWAGGEIWGNLEMYEGYAPSNTLGA
jgi:high affinity Mn2+ porin